MGTPQWDPVPCSCSNKEAQHTQQAITLPQGYDALYSNTTGGGNTALGSGADYPNTIGNFNTTIGYWSMVGDGANDSITGSSSTAVGATSLANLSTGSNNTAIGNNSMRGDAAPLTGDPITGNKYRRRCILPAKRFDGK